MNCDWVETTIDQLGRIVTGKTPPTENKKFFGGTVPFLTPTDMSDGFRKVQASRSLTDAGLLQVKNCLVPRGVAVSCIGWQMGKTVLIEAPTVTNQQINTIIVDETRVDLLFVYYLLSSMRERIFQLGSTATRTPILNKGDFGRLKIWLPPLSEQCTIADTLGALDDRIDNLRQTNATLHAIASRLFKSWFVDFDGVPPEDMQESELGLIPKGWRVSSVKDIGDVVCGKTPSTQVSDYYGDDIPFITIPDMHGKMFAIHTEKRLSHAGARSQIKKMLPAGAICVSCIATLGLVTITTEPSQTNQQINSVVPTSKDETYFWYWTLKNLGEEIKAAASGGSVLGNLNTSRFSELRVNAATKELRTNYSAYTESMFSKIMENERYIATLATLRDTLLPRLLSGRLRISEAARQIAEVAT